MRARDRHQMPEPQRETTRQLLDALAELKRATAARRNVEPRTAAYQAALDREAKLSRLVRRLACRSQES